jgi:hypothetical protein
MAYLHLCKTVWEHWRVLPRLGHDLAQPRAPNSAAPKIRKDCEFDNII